MLLPRVCTGLALCCLLASASAAVSSQTIPLSPDWQNASPPFEGWGTALAWFGNVTGGFPSATRTHLADLLYGRDGLGLNIARYNIGGGNAPETPDYMRAGGAVAGFWHRPAGVSGMDWWNPERDWDWSADAGQRWWLDAIKARVPKDLLFEAFSNSPPYFMTISGLVSGAEDGLRNNLRPGFEDQFATYLVTVVAGLEKRHGIHFRTISPVNEPNTPYWFAANKQEGAHWTPEAQSRMYLALAKALQARGMPNEISGPDETNPQTFALDWNGLSEAAKGVIRQINVHSYETTGKTGVRDVAEASGKRLWMSEVDLSPAGVRQDYDDMRPAIALAEQIIDDMQRLRPRAWVLWQAVEDETPDPKTSSNWGLIKTQFGRADSPLHLTKKYYAFANFTKFLPAGTRFVPASEPDTLVGIGEGQVVAVHVNPGLVPREIRMELPSDFRDAKIVCQAYVTDAQRNLAPQKVTGCGYKASVAVPPLAIATIVFLTQR